MLLGPSAWSLSCVLGSVSPLVSAGAERKQLSCWPASSAPHKGRDPTVYRSKLLLVLLLLSRGCRLCSALSSSTFLTPARLSPCPPAEAKSRIAADFHGGAVYLREQPRAPHPSPLRSELASEHPRRCRGDGPRRGQEQPAQ